MRSVFGRVKEGEVVLSVADLDLLFATWSLSRVCG